MVATFNLAAFTFACELQYQDGCYVGQDDAFPVVKVVGVSNQREMTNDFVMYEDGNYYAYQTLLEERFVGQDVWQGGCLFSRWRCFETDVLPGVLHNDPSATTVGEMFADTLHPDSLCA